MTVKVKTKKLGQLSADELAAINGGTTTTASMTMSSSADSLLSLNFEWQQGDQSRSYKISAGNNIDLNVGAYGNNSDIK